MKFDSSFKNFIKRKSKYIAMKRKYPILIGIFIFLLLFQTNVNVISVQGIANQKVNTFTHPYYTDSAVENFDVQGINLIYPSNIFVSFLENGVIYYNEFNFNNFILNNQMTDYNLQRSDFDILNISNTFLNSSTSVKAVQYFSEQTSNIFAIYHTFQSSLYCTILILNKTNNVLQAVTSISDAMYYRTNSFFTFPWIDVVYFEYRTSDSFIIYGINMTNYSFSKEFESVHDMTDSSTFDVRDAQFYNDTFYIIYNEQRKTYDHNSTVYAFTLENGNLKYSTFVFDTFISSITFSQNSLYCYEQFTNIAYEVNLFTNHIDNGILNSIPANFTRIRTFDGKTFLLEDSDANFYWSFISSASGNQSFYPNQTVFPLMNIQWQGADIFDSINRNDAYTFFLLPNEHYFLSGYIIDSSGDRNKIGFGLTYQSKDNIPISFIDKSKNLSYSVTSSFGFSAGNNFLLIIALGMLLLLLGVFLFGYITQKRKQSQNIFNKTKELETITQPLFDLNICKDCGNKIIDTDVFCQYCGNKLN